MAVIESRSHWNDLVKGIDAKFAEVFDQAIDSYKSDADKLFKMTTDDGARVRHTGKTPAGLLNAFADGANIPRASREKTYDTEYIHTNFGGLIEVHKNLIRDNEWQGELDQMKDLAITVNMTKDENMAEVIIKGFVTTAGSRGLNISRYGDGKALFSTAHPRKDGGTAQSNASSTSITLSATNLNVGLIALVEQLNDDGTPISSAGKPIVVVPPTLVREAIQITQSELDANTANNNINYYKGVIADVVEIKWLGSVHGGSDTAWYLVSPDRAKLFMIMRQNPELNKTQDPDNLNQKYSIDARWSCGHSDWRQTWGSKGDGLAYAG